MFAKPLASLRPKRPLVRSRFGNGRGVFAKRYKNNPGSLSISFIAKTPIEIRDYLIYFNSNLIIKLIMKISYDRKNSRLIEVWDGKNRDS
jgi:hypothetical protein